MVRVHVRPPPFHLPAVLAGLRSLATDREGGPRPPSWARIRAASRQVENVPRAFVRGGQTHFSLKKLCAAVSRRAPSFFRQAGGA